jgi:hypothetical protein
LGAPPAAPPDKALSKLLADTEAELAQANAVWQRRLDEAQAQWGHQVAELEAAWDKRGGAGLRAAEARLADEAHEWERRLRDCEAGWRSKLADCEAAWGAWAFLQRRGPWNPRRTGVFAEGGGGLSSACASEPAHTLAWTAAKAGPRAPCHPRTPGARYAQERQQWEHDRSDWEHWRGRLQAELDDARAAAGLDVRKGVAAQLAEAESRASAERAAVERWVRRRGFLEEAALPLVSCVGTRV